MATDIKGIVLNEKKQPIEFVNITLFKTNDRMPIATTLSDSIGVFTFSNVAEYNYIVEVSYLGYITDTIKNISIKDRLDIINLDNRIDTINVQDNAIQLKEIQLKLNSTTLNEVQVTATKPIYERKADRIIFNVENSVYSQGSDAMQALSKAPRVQVNNNEIKITGRGNAAVLINDRLVRLSGDELSQYLKNIPSNDIQKIEVIPNAPAKYDAQGTALINIVLKKNKKQKFTGSITSSFTQAQYQGGSLGFTFNYTKKKVSLNTSLSERINKDYAEEIHVLKYANQNWNDTLCNPQSVNTIFGRIGISLDINNKNTISFNYIGNWKKALWDKEYLTTRIRNNTNDELIQTIINIANIKRSFYNHNAVIDYTIRIDSIGKKLDVGFDFFNSYRIQNRNYSNEIYNKYDSLLSKPIDKENTNGVQNSYIYTLNIDMEHPLKYGVWSYGAKFTHLNIVSNNKQSVLQADNRTYLIDSTRSNQFSYNEYIQAVYGSFIKIFKKIELHAGLRVEFTQLKGTLIAKQEINKQQYIRPFPSIMVQYKKDQKNTYNFVINSRINRPAFWQLNPFRYYSTPFNYTEGNAFLLPVYSLNASIEYTYKERYNFSLYYNFIHNNNEQVQYADTSSKIYNWKWEGDRKIQGFGTLIKLFFSIKKKWEPTLSIDAYINLFKSPYLFNVRKKITWGMSLMINNDFTFDKQERFTGNINFYFTPTSPNQESFLRAYYKLDIGLNAKILNQRQLILSLIANNILKSKQFNGYLINPVGLYSSFENYYNDRLITFSITYKFGNNKLKIINTQSKNDNINRAK